MSKITKFSIVAALAGFLFGFDTIVISGAEDTLQKLWNSSELFHGVVVVGMALWGTVVGALFGGIPTNRIGRKKTLFYIAILYSVSAIGSALVNDPISFALFRFIGGLGVGASTIAAPAYISEIAPAKDRGRLVGFYQFNIVFGILVAFLSNYLLSTANLGAATWRYMIGIEALPALIFVLLIFKIPQSPRWLYLKGHKEKALEIFKNLFDSKTIQSTIEDIENEEEKTSVKESIFSKKYYFVSLLAFLIAFFNQFSGINAFLYYSKRIFEEAGLGAEAALLSSVGIGIINLIFTLIGISIIDKVGRRTLLFIGSIGYIVSLSLISLSFFQEWDGQSLPIFLFLFIASHAIGQGAIIWVYISEIFPNHLRNSGQTLGTSTHWVLAAIIPSMLPVLLQFIGAGVVFSFFAFMMVLQLIFVIFMMPETKGISLEKLNSKLIKDKK